MFLQAQQLNYDILYHSVEFEPRVVKLLIVGNLSLISSNFLLLWLVWGKNHEWVPWNFRVHGSIFKNFK